MVDEKDSLVRSVHSAGALGELDGFTLRLILELGPTVEFLRFMHKLLNGNGVP